MLIESEWKKLNECGIQINDARQLAFDLANEDFTFGQVLEKGQENWPVINEFVFKQNFESWWEVARLYFKAAKLFSEERAQVVLQNMIEYGDNLNKVIGLPIRC